ncbi:hypothetical protein VTI74DRAFT_7272 [Chaetomium olivicolor]
MHPKFVIIDRQRAFIPSCNVSWEPWLEGCVEITGDTVSSLLSFYTRTWGDTPSYEQPHGSQVHKGRMFDAQQAGLASIQSTAHYQTALGALGTLLTFVLPSSHHRNPQFRPFPWQSCPTPPATPLNVAVLQLFEQAQRSIYIQTPNLTCEAVIAALLDALRRGVDVTIVTNRNMMLLEQLVTAGTTTSWSIKALVRRFHRLKPAPDAHRDLEAGRPAVGHLRISCFRARCQAGSGGHERRPLIAAAAVHGEEPVHSHLKLTIVDGEYTMLGSGNMDRASWMTSQELGVLFHDRQFCVGVKTGVDQVLEGRLDLVFDSEG